MAEGREPLVCAYTAAQRRFEYYLRAHFLVSSGIVRQTAFYTRTMPTYENTAVTAHCLPCYLDAHLPY
ncbi:hypothetical protein AcW1_003178 [Taiwanofungus camphoratus]|nr:hypothetical protein AcW1_003178 [Antrodia cinnamomea]